MVVLHLPACSGSTKSVQPEIFSDKGVIRQAEIRDHNFCLARTGDVEEEYTAHEIYWQCRLQFAKSRKSDNKEYQKNIGKVRKKIEKKLVDLEKSGLSITSEEIEKDEHRECLAKGYTLNTEDLKLQEQYYECRAKLAHKRDGLIIVGDRSYLGKTQLDDINKNGEIKLQVEERNRLKEVQEIEKMRIVDADAKDFSFSSMLYKKAMKSSSLRKQYPECAKYEINTNVFASCKKAYDMYKECRLNIPEEIVMKKVDNKIECEKKAVKQYPDSLISFDYVTDGNEERGSAMKGPSMSRIELNAKRRGVIETCNVENQVNEVNYREGLQKECQEIVSGWK